MARLTWFPTVVLGGPVRPTAAALVTRDEDGAVTVHAAYRLDSGGASEDEQAEVFASWVRTVPPDAVATVLIGRAPGIGRDLERCWRDALPRCHVRTFPLPTGDESARAREDLVTALHLARSRRMFHAPDAVNVAVDTYVRQDPAPFGATLNPHDADPDGLVVPIAVAVRHSDPARQTTIHIPPKGLRINRTRASMVGDLPALIRQAETEAGVRQPSRGRIPRRPWWLN